MDIVQPKVDNVKVYKRRFNKYFSIFKYEEVYYIGIHNSYDSDDYILIADFKKEIEAEHAVIRYTKALKNKNIAILMWLENEEGFKLW